MALFALIPLLPLFASVILVLGGRRWGENGHRIGIPAIWLSFGLSVLAFLEVLNNGPFSLSLYRFFQSGSLVVDINLFVDQLTVLPPRTRRTDAQRGSRGIRTKRAMGCFKESAATPGSISTEQWDH